MRYLLGADLGTTAIKVGLFAESGELVAEATENYNLLYPEPLWVEQEADAYWQAFSRAVGAVMAAFKGDRDDIAAFSISAQGETIVPLDADGNALQNFIVWPDSRAQQEADELAERFDWRELQRVTGQAHMIALSPGAKILWIRRHRPEVFEKAAKYLLIEDYFFYRLGGFFKAEGSLWCTSHMLDINANTWWPAMLDALGLREEQLPEVTESGTPLGTLLPDVADKLGLPRSLLLVMGGLDQSCGAIGVGNVRPGIFSESTGAALVTCTMTNGVVLDEAGVLPCFDTAIPDIYMIHAFGSGGIAYKWLRDALCQPEYEAEKAGGPSAYAVMDLQAEGIPAGSEGLIVLPHFNGSGPPDSNQYAKCVLWGLGLHHTKGHIIKAFMEGIAVNIDRMLTATEKLLGLEIEEIRSVGGGAKSPLWCQIKADVTGKPVVTMKKTQISACRGAMILAGVGAGIFPSVADAAERFVEVEKRYLPNPANRQAYDELKAHYDELTGTVAPLTCKF